MSSLASLQPLNKAIIFKFLDEVKNGAFQEKTESGLIMISKPTDQMNKPRWAEVISVGPKCKAEAPQIVPGSFIMINPLKWTTNMVYNGEMFWATDFEQVIFVSQEKPEEYSEEKEKEFKAISAEIENAMQEHTRSISPKLKI
jgi:co-chaperonin GroES (HSP10)